MYEKSRNFELLVDRIGGSADFLEEKQIFQGLENFSAVATRVTRGFCPLISCIEVIKPWL